MKNSPDACVSARYALAVGVAILLGSSDARAQAAAGSAYVGIFGGLGMQGGSSPPRADPIKGIGPTVGGSIGAYVTRRIGFDGEVLFLRVSDPSSYKSIRSRNTLTQLQLNGLIRWSNPGPPYDIDLVAGGGIARRFYGDVLGLRETTQEVLDVEAGIDVTQWFDKRGVVLSIRVSMAQQAFSLNLVPSKRLAPMLLFGGGIRVRP